MNISIGFGILMLGVGLGALLTRISYHGQINRMQTATDADRDAPSRESAHVLEHVGLAASEAESPCAR